MKPGMLCLLLLSVCADPDAAYDYAVTWVCLSAEGCERTEEVMALDRLSTSLDSFWFESSSLPPYTEHAQRVASDAVPAGCYLLYGFTLFGHELEPSTMCSTPDGYDLEFSIPNRNPATSSRWQVESGSIARPARIISTFISRARAMIPSVRTRRISSRIRLVITVPCCIT